jgi:hypothetical protein
LAQGEEFPEFVLPWFSLEIDDQAPMAFTRISFNAGDSSQPLEKRPLVVDVIETDPCIHVGQRKKRLVRFLGSHIHRYLSLQLSANQYVFVVPAKAGTTMLGRKLESN